MTARFRTFSVLKTPERSCFVSNTNVNKLPTVAAIDCFLGGLVVSGVPPQMLAAYPPAQAKALAQPGPHGGSAQLALWQPASCPCPYAALFVSSADLRMRVGSSAYHLLICACSSAHAQVTVPVNDSRKNVKKTQNQIVTGMCLGVVNARANGIATSLASRLRPNLTRTLVNFAKHAKPGFAFTSIQVNKNYASALHCDANNLGPSYIVGVIHSPCSLPYLSLT